jgi:hypothetical protein
MPSTANLVNADIIAALDALCTAALPTTKIIPRFLLGIEDGSAIDVFRSEEDEKRINALMFWRQAILPSAEPGGLRSGPPPSFDPSRLTAQKGLIVETWLYGFKLYYQYSTGTDAANSQAAFDALIDALNLAISRSRKLGLDSYRIEGHGNLFWSSLTVLPTGGEISVHVGTGQLTVRTHRPTV